MNFSSSDLISVVGILFAVVVYKFDLRRTISELENKLDSLNRDKEGILTKRQCIDLADLYLDAVNNHLLVAVRNYLSGDYMNHAKEGNVDAYVNIMKRAYANVVKYNKRKMVADFLLRGGISFEEMLNSLDQSYVHATFDSLRDIFLKCSENRDSIVDPWPKIEKLLSETKDHGFHMIREKLDAVYSD